MKSIKYQHLDHTFDTQFRQVCQVFVKFSRVMSLQLITTDDSSLMFSSTNPLEIEVRLNLDLHSLDIWVKQWLVDFNSLKTE
jgi:hypothetical protein